MAEMRIHLGGATGQIKRLDVGATGDEVDDRVDRFDRHFFGTTGSGIDMTVDAALVAAIAKVDLNRIDDAAAQGGKVGSDQQWKGGVHKRLRVGILLLTARSPKSLH